MELSDLDLETVAAGGDKRKPAQSRSTASSSRSAVAAKSAGSSYGTMRSSGQSMMQSYGGSARMGATPRASGCASGNCG